MCYTAERQRELFFATLRIMLRRHLLVEFAFATLKIALNGRNLTFLLPLITGHFGAVNLCTRSLHRALEA